MIGELFRTILYQPLFNGLVLLYQFASFNDLGVAIILLTIIVRVILYPVFHKTAKHQRITQELQPEIKKIKETHKKDKEAQTKAIMELYQKNSVNPLTPFFLLLVQLPVLFALYKIFIDGFTENSLSLLYSFVSVPTELSQTFLGIVSLDRANIPIVIIAAAAQFVQGKLAIARSKKQKAAPDQAQKVARAMVFAGPVIALVILPRFPAAVALYWLTSTIFSIMQQAIVNKSTKIDDAGTTNENK